MVPIEGDIVRWVGKNGFIAGYYVRTNRNGNIVVRVPEANNRLVTLKPGTPYKLIKRTQEN